MARPLRIEVPGGLYHVTSRGDRREDIYRDERDYRGWLRIFGEACSRYNWRCHAYCLMTNHYHAVVETAEANLSKGMRYLNGVYTQAFNRSHDLVGHLFQGRFKAILVERDEYLLELSRYVVLNPVRARIAETPEDWPWSSHQAMLGRCPAPTWLETDWLMHCFGDRREWARTRYIEFVREGIGLPSIWNELRNQIYLGSEQFVEKFDQEVRSGCGDLKEVPRLQRRGSPQPLPEYAQRYQDRREAMAMAYLSGAYTMQAIAEVFSVHYATVSRAVRWYRDRNDSGGEDGLLDCKT
ncbi:MAG: transposase [Xanthomonadaceae bacterium]|nr:transposase [Xanthomonadaceae bacterium]